MIILKPKFYFLLVTLRYLKFEVFHEIAPVHFDIHKMEHKMEHKMVLCGQARASLVRYID